MTLMSAFFVFVLVYSVSARNFNDTLRRFTRQTSCGPFQYRCGSGECLSEDLQCDGKVDCRDGSDEETCQYLFCPSYSFQCAYGACINAEFECNGKQDCKDNSDETSPRCTNKNSKGESCGPDQFTCASGECVSEDAVCDGSAQCSDASDENPNVCGLIQCPGYTFRCSYGACVNKNAKCNGKKECHDGSDESPALCSGSSVTQTTAAPIVPSGQNCVLPPRMKNGHYIMVGVAQSNYNPGDQVGPATVLNLTCNAGYQLVPEQTLLVCSGGVPKMPECLRRCSLGEAAKLTNMTCEYNRAPAECHKPFSGMKVTFYCINFYEDPALEVDRVRYCKNGKWDRALPDCRPACGRKIGSVRPLVIGGTVAKMGHYPWQVGIHRLNKEKNGFNHICGGSIISLRVVLSVAHCFTIIHNGTLIPKEVFRISAGKYYRSLTDKRDKNAQVFKIESIYVPERYAGSNSLFENDIAIIVLDRTIKLSDVVQPVCVDWNSEYEQMQLQPNNEGVVLGWGFTVAGSSPSDELRELSVPYAPYKTCEGHLDPDFIRFLRSDKICAGFIDAGVSVCEGDSGGGLSFRLDRDKLYYIRGLVSIAPPGKDEAKSCDPNKYALYTKVSYHLSYIRQIIALL